MKLTTQRVLGLQTSCLRAFVVIFSFAFATTVGSAQESKPTGEAAKSAETPTDSAKPTPAKPVVDAKLPDAIQALTPSIVRVTRVDPKTGLPAPSRNGLAGIVVDPRGYILTPLVDDQSKAKQFKVRLENLQEFVGEVAAIDESLNLMILKIRSPQPLPAVSLAKIREPREGDSVFLVTSPATKGPISGRVTAASVSLQGDESTKFIQTDIKLPQIEGGSLIVSELGEPMGIPWGIRAGEPPVSFARPLKVALTFIKSATDADVSEAPIPTRNRPTEAVVEADEPVDPLKPGRVGLEPATPLAKQIVELFGPRGAKVLDYEEGKRLRIELPLDLANDLEKLLTLVADESLKQAKPLPDSAAENRHAVDLKPATPLAKSLVELFGDRGAKVLEFQAGKRLKVEAPGGVFLDLEKMLKLVANETQKQAELRRTLELAPPGFAEPASSKVAADSKMPAIIGMWSRAESGTFSKLTIWPVENREFWFFVEGAEGNGLLEWRPGTGNFPGMFTFDVLGSRCAQAFLLPGPKETRRLIISPFEDQRKQLLRSDFAKTERELDQKLSSDWTRVETPAQPMPMTTVTVVKTEFEPSRIRELLRAKYREQSYRFFSNDTFRSVIVLAPAEAQEDIEALIHKLDIKEESNGQAAPLNIAQQLPANPPQASSHRPDEVMPDITGTWGPYARNEVIIRRAKNGEADFEMTTRLLPRFKKSDPYAEDTPPRRIKWFPEAQHFQTLDPRNRGIATLTMKPNADGKSMHVTMTINGKPVEERLGINSGEMEWTRTESSPSIVDGPEPADARDPSNLASTPPAQKMRVYEPRFVSPKEFETALQKLFQGRVQRVTIDPRTNSVIIFAEPAVLAEVDALSQVLDGAPSRKPLLEGSRFDVLPNTPAAKQLVEQLHAQESAAAAEAATIRQLQASGQAEQNKQPIAEHQRKLKNLLSTAFDLKLQLEELQVKELHSRLSRLERQIGQRKELREKVIARRAGELIEGDTLKWDSTGAASESAADTTSKSKPTSSTTKPVASSEMTTQVHFTGPIGMEILIADEPEPLIASVRHSFLRHAGETQRYDIGFRKAPGFPDLQFVALLDIYPSTTETYGFAATPLPATDEFLRHNTVPITITEADTRHASSKLLIKVVYLSKTSSVATAIPEIKTLASTSISPGGDVIAAANQSGTILAVLRLALNVDQLGKLDPKSSHAAITRPRLPSQEVANGGTAERSTSSQPSYQEFAKKLATMNSLVAEAEENLAYCQKLFEKGIADESAVAIDRRKVEEAIRNRKAIQDEYAAILRDFELQIESAQVEVDAAKKEVERVDRSEGAGRRKALEDAELRLKQMSLTLERLKVRYDLYKNAGARVDGNAATLPSPAELREQLQPIADRVRTAEARVCELEPVYFRDRSNAAELQRAFEEMTEARFEIRSRLKKYLPAIKQLGPDIGSLNAIVDTLSKKHVAMIQSLSEGKGSEAEVKAASDSWKRAKEMVSAAETTLEEYFSALRQLVPSATAFEEIENVEGPASAPYSGPPAAPQPGYHPDVALAWLEAATDLKLEFVPFDDLKLPFKAALRIREANRGYTTNDLIVALYGHRFDSLDQAVVALKPSTAYAPGVVHPPNTMLLGGLAGRTKQLTISYKPWEHDYLQPGDPYKAAVRLEVRVRRDGTDAAETQYVSGTCVSPDGLVVIPIASQTLIADEPFVVFGTIKGTARIVASDDKHGLTLLKLSSPGNPLLLWVKCRSGKPTPNQQLRRFCHPTNRYASEGDPMAVSEVGQPYPKPLSGNDAFAALTGETLVFELGDRLMSVENELQGLILTSATESTEDAPKKEKRQRAVAIPAVHIQKLIDEYRRTAKGQK